MTGATLVATLRRCEVPCRSEMGTATTSTLLVFRNISNSPSLCLVHLGSPESGWRLIHKIINCLVGHDRCMRCTMHLWQWQTQPSRTAKWKVILLFRDAFAVVAQSTRHEPNGNGEVKNWQKNENGNLNCKWHACRVAECRRPGSNAFPRNLHATTACTVSDGSARRAMHSKSAKFVPFNRLHGPVHL